MKKLQPKKILIFTALIAVIAVLVMGAINRAQAKTNPNSPLARQVRSDRSGSQVYAGNTGAALYSRGKGGPNQPDVAGQVGVESASELAGLLPAGGELSDAEAAGLLYMREEEKLARDVYITLYQQWGLPVFQNISQSEQAHTGAVKLLLDRYGLSDPASAQVGVFTDPALQALYTELVGRGSQSLAEALRVGAAIEEIDILDLQERLAQTDNADIRQVYTNLLNGSSNHLRAFVSSLSSQTGEAYQPQYLSQEAYQAILSAAGQQGGRGSGGAGRGSGAGGGGRRGKP